MLQLHLSDENFYIQDAAYIKIFDCTFSLTVIRMIIKRKEENQNQQFNETQKYDQIEIYKNVCVFNFFRDWPWNEAWEIEINLII